MPASKPEDQTSMDTARARATREIKAKNAIEP
jgi:hypothetical protein